MPPIQHSLIRLLVIVISFASFSSEAEAPHPSIREQIEAVSDDDPQVSKFESETSRKISKMGAAAIPELLALLQHENVGIQDNASYTLSGMTGFTEKDLPLLFQEVESKDRSWALRKIAEIGTPEAIDYLLEERRENSEFQYPNIGAFSSLGAKALPYLIPLFRVTPPNEILFRRISSILTDLDGISKEAVVPLLDIAMDTAVSTDGRKSAIVAIGHMQRDAAHAAPQLISLAEKEPHLSDAVDRALIGMMVPEAVPILLGQMGDHYDAFRIRDIATIGSSAAAAGPDFIRFLDADDWDVRVAAARALGFIKYEKAAPNLIKLLSDQSDWRLVYAAADSLGMMKIKSAKSGLLEVAKSHWFSVVRDTARQAADEVSEAKRPIDDGESINFPQRFFIYDSLEFDDLFESMRTWNMEPTINLRDMVATPHRDIFTNEETASLQYPMRIANRMMPEGIERWIDRLRTPSCGVHVFDGKILGFDSGEWGGKLIHEDYCGNKIELLDKNIHSLHRMKSGLVAVTGIGHLTMALGSVFRVKFDPRHGWAAEHWRALPGDPLNAQLLKSGDLYIDCRGGEILLSPDGKIKMIAPPSK